MDPTPPPWRVFDAPSSAPTPITPSTGTPAARPATSPAPWPLPVAPGIVAALLAAVALGVLAVVVALGGMAGGTPVDSVGGSGDLPFGSDAVSIGDVVVEVAGAVARPGLYHLSSGSRVGDAIAAAGGFGPRVAADRVDALLNLAAIVKDGERILVPSRDTASAVPGGGAAGGGAGSAAGSPGPALIDINQATREQLDTLPGIGLVTADKIIASRTKEPFKTVGNLRQRGLVGQKVFDNLSALITVG